MKKVILCLLITVCSAVANSQKVYFVYLQSESDQPFFIKLNEKVLSSSASGYIILPNLVDSTYKFTLGFPQSKWPEQKFTIDINKSDHGYLVKNLGENGWGLFDLQTMKIQMSATAPVKDVAAGKTETRDVSAFTELLSKASDDPSLKERTPKPKPEEIKKEIAVKEIPKKEETIVDSKKVESEKPVLIKESTPEKTNASNNLPVEKNNETKIVAIDPAIKTAGITTIKQEEVINENPVINEMAAKTKITQETQVIPTGASSSVTVEKSVAQSEVKVIEEGEYTKSVVVKRSESSTIEGFGLVFIDDDGKGIKDTIRVIIPNPKTLVSSVSVIKNEPQEERKFLDVQTEIPVKQLPVEEHKNQREFVILQKCQTVATETDFLSLRRRMAAAAGDDEMIMESKTQFKQMCFTTEQIKHLSTLFLHDESKYKFFDVAYQFVTDEDKYTSLQSELNEIYYINRFKAMLRN